MMRSVVSAHVIKFYLILVYVYVIQNVFFFSRTFRYLLCVIGNVIIFYTQTQVKRDV